MWIMMAGLPGTGKSAMARRLIERLPRAVLLDKDAVRAALFAPADIEYSTRQDDFCIQVMLQVAEYLWRRDGPRLVILDGRTFGRREQVDQVALAAERLGVPLRIIECVCADEMARQRLERDWAQGQHPAQNRTFALYRSLQAQWQPIEPAHLTLHTDGDLDACVETALQYLAVNSTM